MASSELVLAPVIDRNALKRSEIQMQQAMTLAGKKASVSTQKNLNTHIKRGVIKGFDDGMKPASMKLKALGVSIAVAAGAVVADTLGKTFGGLDENIERLRTKMEGIRDISLNAQAFGMDPSRYAALSVIGQSAGMDQGDIQGIMAGFIAALKDEEMTGFKGIADTQGTESAFFSFLSSAGKLKEQDRNEMLISAFGEDDFRLVSRIMQPMMQMQQAGQAMSLQTLFKQMTGTDLDLGSISAGMSKTGKAQDIVTAQQTSQLLSLLTTGVTPGQAGAIVDVAESERELNAAKMTTLDLQVKARIIANELEVGQIKAGAMAVNSVIDYGEALKKFTEAPSVEGYKETIPFYRMFNPNSKGGSMLSDSTTELLNSGMTTSGATAPMDYVTQALADIISHLSSIATDTKEGKEEAKSATYRGY